MIFSEPNAANEAKREELVKKKVLEKLELCISI